MSRDLKPIYKVIIYLVLIAICTACIVPVVLIVSVSVSDNETLLREGYGILPKGFSLEGYKYVLKSWEKLLRSYVVSILVTTFGGITSLSLNALMGYVLSRRDYAFRKQLTVFFTIPMVLNGGMVANYIWITRYLDLKNNPLALVLPLLVVPWFIMLLRTFFSEIPFSLIEAARIDGGSEMTIFTKIILPLSKPALATVAMFTVLNYWNDWFTSLMYIDHSRLRNLQYQLYSIMSNTQQLLDAAMQAGASVSLAELPAENMRMAVCVIAAGPMLMIFPFFQKYFVRGLTVGGVKG